MHSRKQITTLIDDSMFIPLEQYNTKEVKDKIMDLEQHTKTVRQILTHTLKEKIKQLHK